MMIQSNLTSVFEQLKRSTSLFYFILWYFGNPLLNQKHLCANQHVQYPVPWPVDEDDVDHKIWKYSEHPWALYNLSSLERLWTVARYLSQNHTYNHSNWRFSTRQLPRSKNRNGWEGISKIFEGMTFSNSPFPLWKDSEFPTQALQDTFAVAERCQIFAVSLPNECEIQIL